MAIADKGMRAVFNASPIPTAITRLTDGLILLANPACLKMLGWEETDLVGRTMVEVGFWASPQRRASMLELLRSEGVVHDLEEEVRTKSGETRLVLTSIAIVELDGEQCLVGHLYDITERRRLENQLGESEDRFRQVTESVQQGFLLRDVDPPAVLYASPIIKRIFGIDPETLYHDPLAIQALIHPDDRPVVETRRDTMTRAEDVEFRIVRPDGETRWIRSRAEPVGSEDGRVTRIAVVSEDVTDERELREALQASEERFRLLAENSTDVIARSSPDGTIGYISPASRALFGYDPEEMIGHNGLEFVHPDDLPALGADVATQAGRPGETDATFEYRALCKDGSFVWVEARSHARRDVVTHEVIEFHTSVRNIGERRLAGAAISRAKDEAESASDAKSEFLSRMSHELRTPLHAILGFGELLEREGLDATQRDRLDQITKAGRHLLDLINEVLDLTRIERGELRLSLEPVHVGLVVQEALAMVAPLAVAGAVSITAPVSQDLDTHVLADRQRLKQVLLNLLSNAVKYNRDGGQVTVLTTGAGSPTIHIEVVDTGFGIAPEDLAGAFAAFERLGAETTEVEGTGLGLALTKRLIEAMGGEIGVESEVGRGTTFWLELPVVDAPLVADEPPSEIGASIPAALAPRLTGTVLYIEDNPSNVKLVEAILAARPEVRLIVATHGRLGLELALEHRPALVLLDLNLPDLPGQEVLCRLRAEIPAAEMAIVMLSADATAGQVARLRRAGADEYLTKPFDIDRFLAVVDGALGAGEATPREDDDERPIAPLSPPPDTTGPLDLAVMRRLRGLYPDGAAFGEFVHGFLGDSPMRLHDLANAARAGDARAVSLAAHTLRGSCSMIGAHRVCELLADIEASGRDGQAPAGGRTEAVEAAYRDAEAALVHQLD